MERVIENKDLLLRFLKEIQRKDDKESFPLKDYVDLLINPVDLKKNREVKFNEERFPTIK